MLRRFTRFFDVVSALAGFGVLVLLGPVMLYHTVTSRVPLKSELGQIDGLALACDPGIRGTIVRIAGYEREFLSQLDSCGKLLPLVPGRTVRVSIYVSLSALHAARGRDAIRSFGFTADGETVHDLDADLTAARLDRLVLTITGALATVALCWLGRVIANDPLGATRRLAGRPPAVSDF